MADWVQIMIAIIGGGGIAGLAPHAINYFRNREERRDALTAEEIRDASKFRDEMWSQINMLNGQIDTFRGQISVWQQKYFDLTTQNEILRDQNQRLREQNEELKKMVAALEDEAKALQKKLDSITG